MHSRPVSAALFFSEQRMLDRALLKTTMAGKGNKSKDLQLIVIFRPSNVIMLKIPIFFRA
jgi:hypothetical protein